MQGPLAVIFIAFWIVVAFILLIGLFSGFFTVQQQSRAIVERFGRYLTTAKPGLNFKVPYIDYVVQRVSLRVQQLPVEVETKTLDNVFVKLFVAVQFRVIEGSEADSYYKLQDHVEQIKSLCARCGARQGAEDDARRSVREEGRRGPGGEKRTRRLHEDLWLRDSRTRS